MDARAVNDTVYPCGARKAWSTVLGSFLILFCATGVLQAFGVFQDYYTTVFLTKYSASDISWIGSVQVFFELILGVVAGRLYDAGYCRSMIALASLLFSFSYFMLSLVQKEQYYQVFLAQGIGLGIGIGFLFMPVCTLASAHFKSNQALAVGIVLAGGPLGAVLYSIMLNYMLNSSIGFAWSIRTAAFLSTALLLIGNLMITIPPSPPVTSSERKSSLKSMRDWPYILTVMSGFIMLLEMYFPIYFVQLFAAKHGVSKILTFYCLSIINIVGFFSRIASNAYAKHFGAINLSIISCTLNGLVLFGMLGCNTPYGLVLFSIFYGFFFGSTVSLFLPVAAYLAPSDADLGMVLGYAWGPAGIAALVGPPLGAALLGQNYVWWRGVVFAALTFIVAAALQLIARQIHARRIKQKLEMQDHPEKI
ncbi:hypothetical protein AX14_004047 [Amanita brunnescens Koide BX004]|nr:hypothetical protein AX14_004047 [Amanita brunnescens Koide BX004]